MRKIKYFVLVIISFLLINIEDVHGSDSNSIGVRAAGEGYNISADTVDTDTFLISGVDGADSYGYRITFVDKNGKKLSNASVDVYLGSSFSWADKKQKTEYYFTTYKYSDYSKKWQSISNHYVSNQTGGTNLIGEVKILNKPGNCYSNSGCLQKIKSALSYYVKNYNKAVSGELGYDIVYAAFGSKRKLKENEFATVEKIYTIRTFSASESGKLTQIYVAKGCGADSNPHLCDGYKSGNYKYSDYLEQFYENNMLDITLCDTGINGFTCEGSFEKNKASLCKYLSNTPNIYANNRYNPCPQGPMYLESGVVYYTGTGSEIGIILDYFGREDFKLENNSKVVRSKNGFPTGEKGRAYGVNSLIFGPYRNFSNGSISLFGEQVELTSSEVDKVVNSWGFNSGLKSAGTCTVNSNYSLACLYDKTYPYNLYLINLYDDNIEIEECDKTNYNKAPWYRDWNPTANACCPINTKYNKTTKKCEKDTPHVKKTYICYNQANVCSQNNGINSLLNGYTTGYEQLENGGQTILNDNAECILYNGLYLVNSQNSIYCNESITTNFSSFANDLKNNSKSIRAGMLVPIKNFPSVTVLRTCYAPTSVINKTNFETYVKDKIVTPALNFSVSTKYFDNQYSFTSSKGTITASKLSSGKTSYDVDYNRIVVSATYNFSYTSSLNKYVNIKTAEPGSTKIDSNQYKTVSSNVNFKVPMEPKEKKYKISLSGATKENNLFLRILDSDFVSVKSPNNKYTYDLSNIDGQLEACGGECKITYSKSGTCPAGVKNMKASLAQYSTGSVTETNNSKTNTTWKCVEYNFYSSSSDCAKGIKNSTSNEKSCQKKCTSNNKIDAQCVGTCLEDLAKSKCTEKEHVFSSTKSDCEKNGHEWVENKTTTTSCNYTWTFKTTDSNICTQAKNKLTGSTSNFNVDKNSDNCNTNLVFNNRSSSKSAKEVSCEEDLSVYGDLYEKLIFRPIDLSNPFPGKSGSGRTSGKNWNQSTIYTFITSRQDAYEKKPLYSFTLTSSEISEIRKYNDSHNYDDFTLTCTDGSTCYSSFIRNYLTESKSNCYNNSKSVESFNSCANYSNRS